MRLKFRKLTEDCVEPSYANEGDAGLDLTAVSIRECGNFTEYGTGLAFEIPAGFVGILAPRSSVSNLGLSLANSIGVIDSGYRGELKVRFYGQEKYNIGDRIAQLVIVPCPNVTLEETLLSNSERGEGGFGSTNITPISELKTNYSFKGIF